MDRPVTLRAIADRLGVHVSTVSRVLNARAEDGARAASGETAERIRRLAAELGYRPNPHATSLRTSRSNLIGVLVPRLSDLVLATIYEGIEDEAAGHGLSAFVTNTRDDPATQRARTEMVLARRVDGMIFGDAHLDGRLLTETAAKGTPFVLVNRRAPGFPSATCDDVLGGRLVAEHFLALGHERAAVVAGPPHASTGADRTAGFLAAYRDAGAPEPLVEHSGFDTAGGRAAATALLPHRPAAIFAVNDFAAIGAAGAARDAGLRLGADIAVAGFNDTPLAAELPVPLTSVRSPMAEMGRRAVGLLLELLGGEPAESVRLAPSLAVRDSSAGPASRHDGRSSQETDRSATRPPDA
ncbi:LacI family DNA-binding transcriptional regulator [Actinomadura verrucosospora]|uniref:LacI family transcriptional regulator n=1 Tax=Actinomadura verrucosospora TaxID=46165 RepID=A0A7D3VT22_ACTVE|nr:LacI family DNA-binding transcriptional regulator [Actinomadura verrucosospora]QKG22240.1 LacI family transcriptional regulator [Actinomadura verrucosospora]